MCSERDSPLKRLYRRTHAKLTRLAGSGQLVWAAGCELSLALVHARWSAWPDETILRVAPPCKTRPPDHTRVNWPMDASASGSAQVGPGRPHRWAARVQDFRLARSRQDKRLERAIPLITHLWFHWIHWNCHTWWCVGVALFCITVIYNPDRQLTEHLRVPASCLDCCHWNFLYWLAKSIKTYEDARDRYSFWTVLIANAFLLLEKFVAVIWVAWFHCCGWKYALFS